MIIKQLAWIGKRKHFAANGNCRIEKAIFQFASRDSSICHNISGLFYLSVLKLIYSRVTEFSCEQTVIEHCQSYFICCFFFRVGRELIPLAVLWFMVNLLLETYNECWHCKQLKRNVLYLTRATIRNCRHFSFISQSGFQYRNEIMSGQHQQHFSLLLVATSRSKSFNSCWAHLRFFYALRLSARKSILFVRLT